MTSFQIRLVMIIGMKSIVYILLNKGKATFNSVYFLHVNSYKNHNQCQNNINIHIDLKPNGVNYDLV